ncbi:hypothetical protein BJ973_009707 [Actinoplanes tereljensis]|uniref:Uncharacterized protein n=1 Tax=Paractinoplanes tereljensis TaxID=571912 RepID=A0A919TPL3_9ACTN|nr:hypothetical protein [Actinoplanes tereljensis]GIF17331.1 hypothetical protein Ate02nite_00610 [Actinoplanes tereljensis]
MVVLARLESEEWVKWRVGRRRIAWRPGAATSVSISVPDGTVGLAIAALLLAAWLLMWVAVLLATVVAWPSRAISRGWPVVAYIVDSSEASDRYCCWVEGRAAADALARQWAAEASRRLPRAGHPDPIVGCRLAKRGCWIDS